MLTPVVLESSQYSRNTHPRIGDVVTWELWWGPASAVTFSEFEPGWSLIAAVRAEDKPTTRRLGVARGEQAVEQPCIASSGGVQFHCFLPVPVPEMVTVTGALSVTVGTPLPGQPMQGPMHEVDPATLTTATVRRLRVVSMGWANRPTRHAGWSSPGPVPGTEWVYDLAEPPARLHTFELAENDFGYLRRSEVLLVDLET